MNLHPVGLLAALLGASGLPFGSGSNPHPKRRKTAAALKRDARRRRNIRKHPRGSA